MLDNKQEVKVEPSVYAKERFFELASKKNKETYGQAKEIATIYLIVTPSQNFFHVWVHLSEFNRENRMFEDYKEMWKYLRRVQKGEKKVRRPK